MSMSNIFTTNVPQAIHKVIFYVIYTENVEPHHCEKICARRYFFILCVPNAAELSTLLCLFIALVKLCISASRNR